MKFTVERQLLIRMLQATAKRAGRGRPEKMVRLSACGAGVFVESNGKAAGTETLVFTEGACLVVHKTILRLLRGFARGRKHVTFEADDCVFRINNGNWPVAAYFAQVSPPPKFQQFPLA